jgi:predicted DNA-binding WGR domain protein
MSKLLILPGNGALRYNPLDPNGFPDRTHQALVPGAEAALDFYKQQGFTIAVCENAGSVASGVVDLQEKLSEFIVLMVQVAPQIDQLMFCTDYKGAFAYLLTKQASSFPTLRRLRSTQIAGYATLKAPTDDGKIWEDVDVQPFRKPDTGMLDWVIHNAQPQHTVIAWDRGEDKSAAEMTTFQQGRLYIQSAKMWRESFDPLMNEYAVQPQPQTVSTGSAATNLRRFEYVNPAQNVSRFWTIKMSSDQLSFDLNFGRIGTNGRTSPIRKTFSDVDSAKRDYESRIAAQLRDGYIEV